MLDFLLTTSISIKPDAKFYELHTDNKCCVKLHFRHFKHNYTYSTWLLIIGDTNLDIIVDGPSIK
jgi:hypothetical protein